MKIKNGAFDAAYAWTLFTYDPRTGELRNKIDRTWRSRKGDLAGSYYGGYLHVSIGGRKGRDYQAHQIIWLMMTGEWPDRGIDHMNRNGADNSWNNLRLATHSQQSHNIIYGHNTSGTTGVFWSEREQRWLVRRQTAGKTIHIGAYTTKEEAVQVKEELDFIDLRRGWTWHGLWFWAC